MKLRHPIKAILFDAVGTLIYPEPGVGETYATIGAKYGSTLSPADIEIRFRRAFRRQEEQDARNGYRTSEARELERWQAIVAEVFRDQPEPLAPFQELWEHFAKPEAWNFIPGAAEFVMEFAYSDLELGIASNFDCRLRGVVAGLWKSDAVGVLRIGAANHVYTSAGIGWLKPASEFFRAICDDLRIRPEEVLFIGDDLGNDYHASQAAGMQAVLVDRNQKCREVDSVANLMELLDVCLQNKRLKETP